MGSSNNESHSFKVLNAQDDKEKNIICNEMIQPRRLPIASLLNTPSRNSLEADFSNNNNYLVPPSLDSSFTYLETKSCPTSFHNSTNTTQPSSSITKLPSFDNLLANVERLQASFLPVMPVPGGSNYSVSPAGSPYPSPRPLEVFRNQIQYQPLEELASIFLEQSRQQRTLEPTTKDKITSKKVNALFSNWMLHFKELKDFKQKFGHTNVTRTMDEWKNLGNWVAAQRKRMRKGKLPKQQFELLSSLDFEWDRSYYFQRTDNKRLKKDE